MLGWIIVGLLAGLLARALVPGDQKMGCLMTLALGLTGSLVGGFISSLIFNTNPRDVQPHVGGLIMSTLGAILVLAAVNAYGRNRIE